MKKQLLMITMLVSLGATTGALAHTQAHPIGGSDDLANSLRSIRKGVPKPTLDKWKTLVANTTTVDLEVQVGTSSTWERVPKSHYRIFFYLFPKLNIRKAGDTNPDHVLTLGGDQDNAITIIRSVFGDGRIETYQSFAPGDSEKY